MASPAPEYIYKVATRAAAEAAEARGDFPTMPIDSNDGYIHFSTAEQLRETLRLYFAGQDDLLLIAVRSAGLEAGLRWEPSRGGDLFPHHYGELRWEAVANSARIAVAQDGTVDLPDWVR